jgi:L-aminopeptidase/D-esterase-like protein
MNRREFNRNVLAATGAAAALFTAGAAGAPDAVGAPSGKDANPDDVFGPKGLTDVEGLKVGHFTDSRRPTGCTVVLCEQGAVAGVDVRGGAPGTRETDLLNPVNAVQQIYGLVLSGGSSFGLDTATGVMRYLEEKKIGYPMGPVIRVPIVPAAILFDLGVGDWKIRPDAESGYKACLAASADKIEEGNVGAGAGATIGKMFTSKFAMKGGLGTASIRVGQTGLVVAAMVATNGAGDIYDPRTGSILAGSRTEDGKGFRNAIAQMRQGHWPPPQPGRNTTLGVVATNAKLSKDQATKVAQMAHDGYARAINPVHTPFDGDTIFAISTGTLAGSAEEPGSRDSDVRTVLIGALAADAMAEAIVRAVRQATGIPGYPSLREFHM